MKHGMWESRTAPGGGKRGQRWLAVGMALLGALPAAAWPAADATCPREGIWVQTLGTGGPELDDGRASTSFLVWRDGKARVLIDTGAGSSVNFGRSRARYEDLDAILFSHLHIDHSGDFPAYVKGGFFTDRTADLPLFGPGGNSEGVLPPFDLWLQRLFSRERGAFSYLAAFFDPAVDVAFHYRPRTIPVDDDRIAAVYEGQGISISSVPVMHGLLPTLAWRIDVDGRRIVFSGDMNGRRGTLEELARDADLLVAHDAINPGTQGAGRFLHMPPAVIGEIAAAADARQVVLSHFMNRSLHREEETRAEIRKRYPGPLFFADDMACWSPDPELNGGSR